MAKYPIAGWEAVYSEPIHQSAIAFFFKLKDVLPAAAVDVVDSKKLKGRFSTASTLPAIVVDSQFSVSPSSFFRGLSNPLTVFVSPLLRVLTISFPRSNFPSRFSLSVVLSPFLALLLVSYWVSLDRSSNFGSFRFEFFLIALVILKLTFSSFHKTKHTIVIGQRQ